MATIADKLNLLQQTKADIKQAIINKGVEVSDEDNFPSYAGKINSISTSGSDSNLGFEELGYSNIPEYIAEGLIIGKQAYDNFNPNASEWNEAFGENFDISTLVFFPKVTLTEENALWNADTFIRGDSSKLLQVIPDFAFGSMEVRELYSPNLQTVHFNGTVIANPRIFFDCELLRDITIKELNIDNKNISYLFYKCLNLSNININFVGKPTAAGSLFYYTGDEATSSMEKSPYIDFSGITSTYNLFNHCNFLEISEINSINAVDFRNCIWNVSNTIKVDKLDISSITGGNVTFISGSNIRYLLITNMGKSETIKSYRMSSTKWGEEDVSIPLSAGAKQSLIDSLITYSFDRATAGYDTCTITLSTNTKNILSEDEIAQITAKGYTIA